MNLFLPSGTPLLIVPMLVVIEIISNFSRVLSLSIRLFANMMSGHALLKILICFT
jgi:F-type H+-transporting ATPase subunit a